MSRLLMIGMDDWEGLYFEGVLLDEGHSLETEYVVAIVRATADISGESVDYRDSFYDREKDSPLYKYADDDEGRLDRLPMKLSAEDFDTLFVGAEKNYYENTAYDVVKRAFHNV